MRSQLASEIIEFSTMLRVGDGDLLGEPLKLLPFQIEWIEKAFGEPQPKRAILSVGRRNGKTALCSMLVLSALIGPLRDRMPGALIISASRSREQAALLWRYAFKMAQQSGLLGLLKVRETQRELIEPHTQTTYRAISADATNALGIGPSLCIADELGAVVGPRDSLFDSLASSLGTFKNSLLCVISTQARSDGDLLSLLIDDALSGQDPRSVVSLHCAGQDDDIYDPATWRKANPAMGAFRSTEDLEHQAAEAKRLGSSEARFRNYALNQRVAAEAPFLTKDVWERNQTPPDELTMREGLAYGGLDLSRRTDLTSLCLTVPDDTGQLHTKVWTWTPADTLAARETRDRAPYQEWVDAGYLEALPGASLPYDVLAKRISDICQSYRVVSILYDRWAIETLKYELEKLGSSYAVPLEPCGQGFKDFGPAVAETSGAALNGDLRVSNPVLTWAVANAVLEEDAAGSGKLSKKKSWQRIDPAVALCMAVKAARHDPGGLSLAETDGIMFLD